MNFLILKESAKITYYFMTQKIPKKSKFQEKNYPKKWENEVKKFEGNEQYNINF